MNFNVVSSMLYLYHYKSKFRIKDCLLLWSNRSLRKEEEKQNWHAKPKQKPQTLGSHLVYFYVCEYVQIVYMCLYMYNY